VGLKTQNDSKFRGCSVGSCSTVGQEVDNCSQGEILGKSKTFELPYIKLSPFLESTGRVLYSQYLGKFWDFYILPSSLLSCVYFRIKPIQSP